MRRRGDAVDGVILLDKPLGLSSNRALQTVRRLLNAQKAGHTGTLDPLATGLLPLCFGNATKFSADLLHADKRYEARVMLGVETEKPAGEIVSACLKRGVLVLTAKSKVRLLPPLNIGWDDLKTAVAVLKEVIAA